MQRISFFQQTIIFIKFESMDKDSIKIGCLFLISLMDSVKLKILNDIDFIYRSFFIDPFVAVVLPLVEAILEPEGDFLLG